MINKRIECIQGVALLLSKVTSRTNQYIVTGGKGNDDGVDNSDL